MDIPIYRLYFILDASGFNEELTNGTLLLLNRTTFIYIYEDDNRLYAEWKRIPGVATYYSDLPSKLQKLFPLTDN
jgi:hypothetical protein